MATVREERESIKLRLAKKQHTRRITIIDHAGDQKLTCDVAEGFNVLNRWIEKGDGEKVIHIVDHDEELKRKLSKERGGTRVILDCRTPEQRAALQAAKEPYFAIARDPHIAIDLVIRALSAFSAKTIESWVRDGYDQAPGQVDLPSWARD